MRKKIVLKKVTLRDLSSDSMRTVVGGVRPPSTLDVTCSDCTGGGGGPTYDGGETCASVGTCSPTVQACGVTQQSTCANTCPVTCAYTCLQQVGGYPYC